MGRYKIYFPHCFSLIDAIFRAIFALLILLYMWKKQKCEQKFKISLKRGLKSEIFDLA